jgi:hypothetical protein
MTNEVAENIQFAGIDPITADPFLTALCGAFVAYYAFRQYDTPETNRQSTTRSLFIITGLGYVIVTLIFYFILCEIILKPGVLPFFGQSMAFLGQYSRPPIIAAVILTTLLPNIKFLRDWDESVLNRFQKWGSIPFGVNNLAAEILQVDQPAKEDLANLRQWMSDEGEIPNELLSRVGTDAPTASQGSLTRALRLHRSINKLASLPLYSRAAKKYEGERQKVKEEFRVYAAISQAFFVLFDHLSSLEGSAGENARKQAKDRYLGISDTQARSSATLVARLLLATENSETSITKRLLTIGLGVREARPPSLPIGPLVFVGAVVIALILAVTSFLPRPQPAPGGLAYYTLILLIGVTKTIGTLAAILPKICWSSARAGEDGRLPYLSWLGWAALAALGALLIERLALGASSSSFSAALDFQSHPVTPIAPTTFVICISISILCDLNLPIQREGIRRILEGTLCGAAMVVALAICFAQAALPTASSSSISPLLQYGFPFMIGFFWGAVGPYLYRKHRHQIEDGPPATSSIAGAELHARSEVMP